jgi:hypothetical protein
MRFPVHEAIAASFSICLMAISPSALAKRITLNDTGLTQCTKNGAWSSECDKSRQDAAYGRDASQLDPKDGWAGFSFRKVCRSGEMSGEGSCPEDPVQGDGPNDWACTYDNVTELVWEMKTADDGKHGRLHFYTNKGKKYRDDPGDAAWLIDSVNSESLCGATNWRLPNVVELQSIVNYGAGADNAPPGGWVDQNFFPNNYSGENWTSTGNFSDPRSAWTVYFVDGDVSFAKRFDSHKGARLVHSQAGEAAARTHASGKPRFIPSDDGTEITDTMTGLVWRRCAEGMTWDNVTLACEGTALQFTWKEALHHAGDNREGGWRMPNIKELVSIVDYSTARPAIDSEAFPDLPGSHGFISSTPDIRDDGVYVRIVSFFEGQAYDLRSDSSTSSYLRLVRKGRQ